MKISLDPAQELTQFGYTQELKRKMGVWQLTAFGLNYMIPLAPAIIFGFLLQTSGGTVALPYLLACIGMLFTANSYSIMVQNFPVAGSLYSYVSRGINPSIGFIAGWVLLLDYILIPIATSMSSVDYLLQFLPHVKFEFLFLIFVLATGLINIFNVEVMGRLGLGLLIIGEIILFTGFVVWAHAVIHQPIGAGTLLSSLPFHFSSFSGLEAATSISVLSYLGFDAITTLSEEAVNPKRDIPRAIFLSLIFGAFTMVLTGYLGMLVIPDWHSHIQDSKWLNTTLFYVSKVSGGSLFGAVYTAGFVLSMAVFNTVAVAAGARLLFGMGRDGKIPKYFARLHHRFKTPVFSILLILAIEFILGSVCNLEAITEVINFGAVLGFCLLNLSVIWLYFKKTEMTCDVKFSSTFKKVIYCAIAPLLGIIVMGWLLWGMHKITLITGISWLCLGCILAIINAFRNGEK